MNLRSIIWSLTIIILCLLAWLYGTVTSTFDAAGIERTWLTFGMGVLGIVSVYLFPTFSNTSRTLYALCIPAILVRLIVFQAAPSDDIHRYLWEGKLWALGEDPYEVLANDPSRIPLRDQHWEPMNHKDQPTAYPPIAIQTFSFINKLGYSPLSYKWIFTLLDLALIACLLTLLRSNGKPLKWASFYALSPLSFLSYSAEAHFDILMVFWLMLGVLCFSNKRYVLSGIALALAIHFKLMVAVAIPFLLWRSPLRMWMAFAITMAAPVVVFYEQTLSMLEAVHHFGSVGSFNGSIYQLLQWLVPEGTDPDEHRELINRLVAAFFALSWVSIAFSFLRKKLPALTAAVTALAALLIFSPIVHFWYLAWLLPFVALSPKASWLSLSVTFGFYFLVWQQLELINTWEMPLYARWLFWIPFFMLSLWQIIGRKRVFATSARIHSSSANTDISIVIPTRNPGLTNLQAAIQSIRNQSLQPKEVIIVDADSTDESIEAIQGCTVIQSPAGRGLQIKTGVEAASSDWVVILHADAVLAPGSLKQLQNAILTNLSLVGGSFGQRFDSSGLGLLTVEILNEVRAHLATTNFGDQAQFLHRPTALKHACLTDQPLMEDVEISDRLRRHGEILYLGNEVIVSAEKWRKHPFWERFLLVVRYFAQYRLMFWKPAEQRKILAEQLVADYYSSRNA